MLSKNKLIFNPANSQGDVVGSHTLDGNGNQITSTAFGAIQALDVNLAGSSGTLDVNITNASIEVTATDLDIRDLSALQDNVAIADGANQLAVNLDGSINVNATDQGPIRFRDSGGTVVDVQDTIAPLPVQLQSLAGPINVTAGDLNVQLSHTGATFDSIRIGDGTDLAGVTANSDLQVADIANNAIMVSSQNVGNASPAALLTSQLANRKMLFIQNLNDQDIEIGQSGFTKGQGFVIPCGNTLELKIGANVDVHAVSDSSAVDIRTLELS